MNKVIIFIFLLFVFGNLLAQDYLDLNFFIEPKFDQTEMNMVNFLIKNIRNDSIRQFNVFVGRMLKSAQNDSLTLQLLNLIKPDLASPTDYLFYDKNVNFNLLSSNVISDSVPILDRYIVKTDSITVGFISIYAPDWVVKNEIASHAELKFKVFDIVKDLATDLAPKTDYIILLSGMSKFIDTDLIHTLPIDVVVSFDYQKKDNEKLNRGKSSFYSILTSKGKYGKLRLTYKNGKVSHGWKEVDFKVGK
ncbi:MAG: hypothetical protein Q7J16_09870 [Candidatus Cloacimonadales bacterium]|nr:hypothetical protein [Candidatus Cloacimonadales bacterium]